jgi:putative hydrolase of the HAD superfamily
MERLTKCILFDWGDTLMRVFTQYSGAMADWPYVEPVTYAPTVLAELYDHCLLAVATNAKDSGETQIWSALERAALADYLDFVFCYRTIGHLKPSPEFYASILNQLKLPATHVIMVGDEWNADILGANQAGLRAVWLNVRTPENRHSERFQTIHSLLELPERLKRWGFIESVN